MAGSHWGLGIASEAARAVIGYGFTTMKLHRIQAHTIADNHRSVQLLERLGFRREGTLREYSLVVGKGEELRPGHACRPGQGRGAPPARRPSSPGRPSAVAWLAS